VKEKVITAGQVKAAVISQYLYHRKAACTITEKHLSTGNVADILIIDSNLEIIEIEVKVSKADLQGELRSARFFFGLDPDRKLGLAGYPEGALSKVEKHRTYSQLYNGTWSIPTNQHYRMNLYPNKFYFAIPLEFEEMANEKLAGTPYGIITVGTYNSSYYHRENVVYYHATSKRAKKLHNAKITTYQISSMMRRLSFENLRLLEKTT